MIDFIVKSVELAFAIVTGLFTLVPEAFFGKHEWITHEALEQCNWFARLDDQAVNIIISRLVCFLLVWVGTSLLYTAFLKFRRWITIKGQNYSIRVEYGNILKKRKCKRVIDFDECFTTQVGNATEEINPDSICGQYLTLHSDLDVQRLIEAAKIKPARSKSKYLHKTRYDSGTIVQNGDDLLMAFAKLDKDGRGWIFSRQEFLDCLSILWDEIDKYYGQKDVYIPILGSGVIRFEGTQPTQQELLDIIIGSYRLSIHKIKYPYKLHIVCKKRDGFSLNKIGENL